jgi:tRNA(Ile)-lysidine synthase
MDLAAHVETRLQRHCLAHTTGIVAVSGGPDSVALAHLLAGLLQAGKLERLILAHVNHQLRGDESDADETFVKSLPQHWRQPNLACCSYRIDVAAIAHAEHDNLEGTARRERYRWFTQLAHEHQAAWIAAGHTADDQAETVLFRLLRGSGVLGLCGMSERRTLDDHVALLRPLLNVRRQALLDYLQAGQIPYRRDSSNRDLGFTRNRLRLELLPRLQTEYNPAIVDVLCRLADQAGELHADVSEQALQLCRDAELPRAGGILLFSAERLCQASNNLVRETFRRIWQRENWPMGDMDFARWNRLVEIVHGLLPAWDFPGGIHVRRAGNVVQIQAKPTKSS